MKKCKICKNSIEHKDFRRIVCSNECRAKWLSKKALMSMSREKAKTRRLKLRFEVFQKYNFSCIYCGRKPPECILEVDHKYPQSKGGKDSIENYVSACRECNVGKRDVILKEFEKVGKIH